MLGDVQCIEIDLLQNKLHNYFRSSGLSPYYMADIGIKHKTVLTSFCNKEEANTEPVTEISPVQEHSVICQSTNLVVSEEVRYFLSISRAKNTMFQVRSRPNRKGDAPYASNLGQYCLRSWLALQTVIVQERLAARPMVLLDSKVKAKLGRNMSQILSHVIQGKERISASSSDLRC